MEPGTETRIRMYTHIRKKHMRQALDQYLDQGHTLSDYCNLCQKYFRGSIRTHAREKHAGTTVREFVQSGIH